MKSAFPCPTITRCRNLSSDWLALEVQTLKILGELISLGFIYEIMPENYMALPGETIFRFTRRY